MRILEGKAAERAVAKLEGRASRLEEVEPNVRKIIQGVRKGGDKALVRYATLWDKLEKGKPIRVPQQEMEQAWETTPADTRDALKRAAANIRRFANWQMPKSWRKNISGGELGQVVRPLASVGCYVPGGRYPLPSTLLMTAIPAQVAGVERIVVVTPNPQPATLAAARLLWITEVYRCGGAQGIAALAYGTESIARVDKIVGPGNAFVTAAKKLVSFECAIDMLAGPTEAVVLSDNGDTEFIASDLVSQAEHDPDAVVVFVSTKKDLAEDVTQNVERQAKGNAIAQQSVRRNAYALVASTREQAIDWVNRIAPEHLTVDDDSDLMAVRNAGSVFVGNYSPQSAGDYAAGPNHVLPTAGAARFRGGLSVADFVKIITVQKFTSEGLREIASVVTKLAETEGLRAHAESVRVRSGNA
ncbi:MAG TPA: histidinol dehydrogenase [Candidatus Limnocylindrales bacterium]|nr:histidinol dehydrogenase [Candidatus Limnocylindrales bacterium]